MDPHRALANVALQEVATRAPHRNTGRYSQDPVADRIMDRIAADENLHAAFYRDILSSAAELQPSATLEAVVEEIIGFEMPGAGIAGFRRKAAQMAIAGIYDLRIHRDEVVLPLVRRLRLLELDGLTPSAEAARARLVAFLEQLEVGAQRADARRAGADQQPMVAARP
jgi:acyl-[acyl-carrier-protein] desaturase